MPRATSSRDIDSLPYHALQAEAAKYSIRRNLGSAKLKIAIKRVQETGGDTKGLPREWLTTATPADSTEPSCSAPAVMNPSSRQRKIIPRPKESSTIAPQRQPKDRLPASRIPSKNIKKDFNVEGLIARPKFGGDGIVKASRDRAISVETSSALHLPLTHQPDSAGPMTKEDPVPEPPVSSQGASPQPTEPRSASDKLEEAVRSKALEMGITGVVPPEMIQFLIRIICQVLGGLLSGNRAALAAQKVLEQKLMAMSVGTSEYGSHLPTSSIPLNSHVQPSSDIQPAQISGHEQCPVPPEANNDEERTNHCDPSSTSASLPDSTQPATWKEAAPVAHGSLRRKACDVESLEGPPKKKNKTSAEGSISQTPETLVPVAALRKAELDENLALVHTSLSPIIEDPQHDETRPSTPYLAPPFSPRSRGNTLREPQSKNIFPSSSLRRRPLNRQGKPPGSPSPVSKPTLYGTEHMYGHSSAPFGELYDNTDMTFLYDLAHSEVGKPGGMNKNDGAM